MTAAVTTWMRRIVLALMLPLACLVGNVAPYIVALILIGYLVVLLARRRLVATYRSPLPAMFLIVFVVLGVCFSITADEPRDALSTFNFVMLLLAGPLVYLLGEGASPESAGRLAWLSLAGAGVALLIVLVQVANNVDRAAWLTLGPIRMANTAVILGFLALIGWFTYAGGKRWIFLSGPLLGLGVTVLTESRGPLLAFALAAPVALGFFLAQLPPRSRLLAIGGTAVVLVLGVLVLSTQERIAVLPGIIGNALSGAEIIDTTTSYRLLLYEASIEAFIHAPWIGYGWHNMMEAIAPYLAEGTPDYVRGLPQLHNDVLDFAVAAGVVGILAYLLLLVAPIYAALRSARDAQRSIRVYGATVLVACYVGAGLTDLMFGFEFHTALYVVLAAVVVGYCRDSPPAIIDGEPASPPANHRSATNSAAG